MADNEVISSDKPTEWDALARVVGSVLNPLAQGQAEIQKASIDAQLQRDRLAIELRREESKRAFHLSISALVLVSALMAGLFVAGQYQFALNGFIFIAGIAAGRGYSIAKRQ